MISWLKKFKIDDIASRSEHCFGISIMNKYSPAEYDDYNLLHIQFFKKSFWFRTPLFFKPKLKKVIASSWSNEYVAQVGRNWYIQPIQRHYGISISSKSTHLYYGQNTMQYCPSDPENDTKVKVIFYPWQWEMVRYEKLSLDQKSKRWNANRKSFIEDDDSEWGKVDSLKYQIKDREEAWKFVPFENSYAFVDCVDPYDGKIIQAKVNIEEREWRRGEKWPWKILHYLTFLPNMKLVIRRLDIELKEELGSRKGSWKGGLMGTSIIMKPNETWEEAWERFKDTDLKKEKNR